MNRLFLGLLVSVPLLANAGHVVEASKDTRRTSTLTYRKGNSTQTAPVQNQNQGNQSANTRRIK